jgi:hypothetical protein
MDPDGATLRRNMAAGPGKIGADALPRMPRTPLPETT